MTSSCWNCAPEKKANGCAPGSVPNEILWDHWTDRDKDGNFTAWLSSKFQSWMVERHLLFGQTMTELIFTSLFLDQNDECNT
jgi:hypothetical protein